jgi:hypothetical protein
MRLIEYGVPPKRGCTEDIGDKAAEVDGFEISRF